MDFETFCKLNGLNEHAPDSREQYRQYLDAHQRMSEVCQVDHLDDVAHV